MFKQMKIDDFSAIRLKLASPDEILSWSHGEVLKPETINYRTQRPEKDGLFCEKIFGPTKDWECYCGKYKKIRYKGIICDKCGVEVTRSVVRRERMGHIKLSVPVSHIWFLRGVPSKIGLVLDISIQNLEKVIYFANFIITTVDEDLKAATMEELKSEYKSKKKGIDADYKQKIENAKEKGANKKDIDKLEEEKIDKLDELEETFGTAEKELKDLKPLKIVSESEYHDLSLKYGHVFDAGIGAEAIRKVLENIDLDEYITDLETQLEKATGAKREKLMKRVKVLRSLRRNNIRPEWMIMTVVPVIPPDLRPMVPLDGGRFATSDLNDLYRRIINRNNRLKHLIELKAPEVISRNEKRMLQEAVDALIDNGARHGKTVTASTGQKRMLKSIADMLKGKQGRFRQNLLGKRTDYSGRSVIVVGPNLALDQCGIPKKMALELFKPFVMSQLIKRGFVHNVRSASRFIESDRSEVWDILAELTKDAYVLLNRAPTLHRLGIQAFRPTLIEGKAIQVHPLVCAAFNADFDGDQMAVHLPLTKEAREEANRLMLSKRNLLKPATGDPIAGPTKDMVWGCYYLTMMPKEFENLEATQLFADKQEAKMRFEMKELPLHKKIRVMIDQDGQREVMETTVGRIMFNEVFEDKMPFVNEVTDKKVLGNVVSKFMERHGQDETADLLDRIKNLGFESITLSGFSWGMDDIPTLDGKPEIIEDAERQVEETQSQYEMGLLTESERYTKVINIWTEVKDRVASLGKKELDPQGSVSTMVASGARGNWGQLNQIVAMKGLVTNPVGEIIELPIKASFKEGFGVLEYFISTHGARKGLSDTALRTANAGYLTRRLVDVAQDVITREDDCETTEGMVLSVHDEDVGETYTERAIGRYFASDVVDAKGKTVASRNDLITQEVADAVMNANVEQIHVRSLLTCESIKGVCRKCYGVDLGYNKEVKMGTAVGIIAAQSIGEPGTQLTMRTFHTGGIAGDDITQGLPRVEEIFEARTPKRAAHLAEADGKVKVDEVSVVAAKSKKETGPTSTVKQKVVKLSYTVDEKDIYVFEDYKTGKRKAQTVEVKVKDGDKVSEGTLLFMLSNGKEITAERGGVAHVTDDRIVIDVTVKKVDEYLVPMRTTILVNDGDMVKKGDKLTEGNIDLKQLFRLKGREATQRHIITEIKQIYSSQGQKLNDKHCEVIARQMFSRVYVVDPNDTNLLPGEKIEMTELLEENNRVEAEGGKKAEFERLLLGVTKVSLSTRSFLAAASFQQTAKVLIDAAITGKIDNLEGLKENVIIGRLIPVGQGFEDAQDKESEMKAEMTVETQAEEAPESEGEEAPAEGSEEGKE